MPHFCALLAALVTIEEMEPTLTNPHRKQEKVLNGVLSNIEKRHNQVIEAVKQKIAGFDSPGVQGGDVVLVAVALPRLNGHDAYFIAGVFTVVEHEDVAILRAPRDVAKWLRDDGVFQIVGLDPTPEPVQIIEQDIDLPDLETAIILWNPLNAESVYGSFEATVEAASKLTRS